MTYTCSKCGAPIPLEDFETGKAVYTDGISYCSNCVAAVLPMLKALDGEQEDEEYVARVVKTLPRPAMDHFSSHQHIEPKTSNTGLLVIGAGAAVLLIIGLVVAFSGNGGTSSRQPVNNKTTNKGLPPPQNTGRQSWELTKEVKSFTQDEINKINEDYSLVEKSVDSEIDPFKKDTAKLQQFKNSREMPEGMKANIDRKVNSIITARVSMAKAELDKFKAHSTGLVKEWKLKEALEYLDTFPEKYSAISGIATMLEEEKAKIRNKIEIIEAALEEFERIIKNTNLDELLKQLEELRKYKGGELSPELAAKITQAISKTKTALEKQKAQEDKKIALRREKEKAARLEHQKKVKQTRESDPLHFADWTGALPSLTANFKVEGAKHVKYGKKYSLLFPKNKQGKISVEIELGEIPEIAFLKIIPSAEQSSTALEKVPLAVSANKIPGNIVILKKNQSGPLSYEIDLKGCIIKGKNTLKIEISPAAEPFMLAKIELRFRLSQEELKKVKARARVAMRKLLAAVKREKRSKRQNGNGNAEKKPIKWPPKILAGQTVSVFNGKDLSCWKIIPPGNWSVKNGEIVGIGTGNQPTRLMTDFAGQNNWKDYEIEFKLVVIKGEIYIGVHGTVGNAGAFTGSEVGPSLPLNQLTTINVKVINNLMHIKINDKPEAQANGNARFTMGAPYLSVEPNSEAHVKSVKFTLKSK